MKQIARFLLISLVCCLLFGCSSQQKTLEYYLSENGVETLLTMNPDARTITDGTHTYTYDFSRDADGCSINLTYPNGAEYYYVSRTSNGISTGSGDFKGMPTADGYADPEVLCRFVQSSAPASGKQYPISLSLILIILGLLPACFPRGIWFLRYGWQFRDAEPSDAALWIGRISGIAVIGVGIVFLFL